MDLEKKGYKKMKVVRKSVFETNSSSVHSLVIYKDNSKIDLNRLPKTIVFRRGVFGRWRESFNGVESAASYLYTALNCGFGVTTQDIINLLAPLGIKCIFIEESTGYIDHEEDLEQFIKWVFRKQNNLLFYLFGGTEIETYCDEGDNFLPDGKYEDYKICAFVKGN